MPDAFSSSNPKSYPRARFLLAAPVLAACLACGAVASSDPASVADASTAVTGDALTIAIGQYTSCSVSTVNVTANLEASNGGNGTVTLSADGDGGLSAALSFDQLNVGDPGAHVVVASGTLGFAPTTGTTAALSAGSFAMQTLDGNNVGTSVPVAASALSLVGDMLFISVLGQNADTKFSGFALCSVPASLPKATLVSRAPTTRSIPTGTYSGCTTASAQLASGLAANSSTGGNLSLTVTSGSDHTWTATQAAGFPTVCGGEPLAFDDVGASAAALRSGQTCAIALPCGPPPSLGPSAAPNEATLANLSGSIEVVGGALFINVTGDAPSQACGAHTLSLICPAVP